MVSVSYCVHSTQRRQYFLEFPVLCTRHEYLKKEAASCEMPVRILESLGGLTIDNKKQGIGAYTWHQRFSFTVKTEERERSDERKPLVAGDVNLTIML